MAGRSHLLHLVHQGCMVQKERRLIGKSTPYCSTSVLQLDWFCSLLLYNKGQNLDESFRNLHYDFLIVRIYR